MRDEKYLSGNRDWEREEAILKMRAEGKTLQEIGEVFQISRERVRQILMRNHPNRTIRERFINRITESQRRWRRVSRRQYAQCVILTHV